LCDKHVGFQAISIGAGPTNVDVAAVCPTQLRKLLVVSLPVSRACVSISAALSR